MPSVESNIEQQVRRELPDLPCFARLKDARQYLDALTYSRHPELHSHRLFVVIHGQFDRDPEHPGLWLRPLLKGRDQRPQPAAFWLPADKCVLDPRFPIN